jgi:hypothetical protein
MAGNAFLNLVNGVITMVRGLQVSAGVGSAGAIPALNSQGQIDITMLPTGVGPDTTSIVASEALSAGALVNVWANAGVVSVRNADNSAAGKPAHGFVLTAFSSAATALVYFYGNNNAVTGLTPGATQYLGTVGATVSVAPTAAGAVCQQVGEATAAGNLNFDPQYAITLA